MLTVEGRDIVHSWIDRGLRPWRQVRWMLVGSAVSTFALFAMTTVDGLTRHLYVDAASYVTVAITGAAGASSLFWFFRAARLARLITKWRNIRLWWFAPARTPGLECLSRWYRIVTLLGAVGAAVGFAPIIYLASYVPGSGVYLATKWGLAAIMLAAILLFGFYSQWRLSAAVTQKRLSVLHRISRLLPRHPPALGAPVGEQAARLYELFAQVQSTPTGVIDSQTVASTILAMATGLIPVAVTLLIR
jgi:hypothetical protein